MKSLPDFDQSELHELENLFQLKLEEAKDSFEQLAQEWDEDDEVRQGFASRFPQLALGAERLTKEQIMEIRLEMAISKAFAYVVRFAVDKYK